MTDTYDREPTADEQASMNWWNALTHAERAHWLHEAQSAVAAEAWEAYKRQCDSGPRL